jgi:hypothetical protein
LFAYAISSEDCSALGLRYEPSNLVIVIPKEWAKALATTDQIGYETQAQVAAGTEIRVLIEKDFRCMEARAGEDDADAYPNPSQGVLGC